MFLSGFTLNISLHALREFDSSLLTSNVMSRYIYTFSKKYRDWNQRNVKVANPFVWSGSLYQQTSKPTRALQYCLIFANIPYL